MRNETARAVDVLVVGLGPAGASAARAAAEAGASVLAIERRAKAGEPVQCAEFVPSFLGRDTAAVDRARVQGIEAMTTEVPAEPASIEPSFTGHMIDRARFDQALAAEARRAGAQTDYGVSLRTIDEEGNSKLSNGTSVAAAVIVGADGPRSRVGATIGRVNTELSETRQIRVPLAKPCKSTDIFLSEEYPGGYGWLFPKGSVANLGLGLAPEWKSQLRRLLSTLHLRLIAEGRVGRDVLNLTGGPIPAGGMLEPVGRRGVAHVLLAGDAAGLANPITGAGIQAAVLSGRLAGEAAARLAGGDTRGVEDYREELSELIGPSLKRALDRRRRLMSIHAAGGMPDLSDLKRAWIAFPEYWVA